MPALPAAGRLARAGRAREGRAGSATRRTGAGRCRASATRTRGSCCSGSRRRPTAATGRGASSPATRRATSCGRRSIAAGLADRPASRRADDGLTLTDVYIAAAVRCAPPANKPTTEERDTCAPFLVREMALLSEVRVIVALGAFGWDAALRALAALGHVPAPKPRFGHGAEVDDRAVSPARLLPPEPAEHVHGPPDVRDVRGGPRSRYRPGLWIRVERVGRGRDMAA